MGRGVGVACENLGWSEVGGGKQSLLGKSTGMPLETYRDLDVWGTATDWVVAAYGLPLRFPDQERYGLRSQIQRAAVSIPANIAEGHGRLHRGDYVHH